MKPAPFEYIRPLSLAEACALLAGDEDARAIAGGQKLASMLAMRLARPTNLSISCAFPSLQDAHRGRRGRRRRDNAASHCRTRSLIRAQVPALAAALPWVGHPPTRNRGTVGGSIANADPSAEIPLVAVTLGAEIMLATPDGPSSMPADDFFIGPMLTTIAPGECVSAVRFPVWEHRSIGVGFFEVSARRSDFAFASALAQVALDEDGRCIDIALGVGGVGDRPLRLDVSPLLGTRLDAASVAEAVHAVAGNLEASSDLHASASYRRRVAITPGKRAIEQARTEAGARALKGAA